MKQIPEQRPETDDDLDALAYSGERTREAAAGANVRPGPI